MNRKISLMVIVLFSVCFSAFCQTAEYAKVHLSFRAGMDFPLGVSNTLGVDPEFTIPLARGFGASVDGAYFFHKNFGTGLKYHLFFTGVTDGITIRPDDKYVGYSFHETTHFIGPSILARLMPTSNSKWEIPVSVSVGYVSNKLSKYKEVILYQFLGNPDEPTIQLAVDPDRMNRVYERTDLKANSFGIGFSTGVSYHISPVVSIGIYADGMFSSAKKQNFIDHWGKRRTVYLSRAMNKIGISAGINFNF